jgi:single-stranded-DNA-specific exonuclease
MEIMLLSYLRNLTLNKPNSLQKSNNIIQIEKNSISKLQKKHLTKSKKIKEQDRFTTVVFQEDWHKGVIGIVASRLIETYYKPNFSLYKSGDKYAASARICKGL